MTAGATAAVIGLVVTAVLLWPRRRVPMPPRRPAPPAAAPRRAAAPTAAALADLFAAALESGLAPAEATRWCARRAGPGGGPVGTEPVVEPAGWWRERVPAVARALEVTDRVGSPAALAVRAAAEAARDVAQAERDLDSGLAGVRVTAWLLTALPVGGAALALATVHPSPVAVGSMLAGGLLTAAGWRVLHALVARARRAAHA